MAQARFTALCGFCGDTSLIEGTSTAGRWSAAQPSKTSVASSLLQKRPYPETRHEEGQKYGKHPKPKCLASYGPSKHRQDAANPKRPALSFLDILCAKKP